MSAPVLTMFSDAAPCPRVEVFFADFILGTTHVTVYRLSGGREFEVRGAVRAAVAGSLSRIDFEVPFNVQVSYRAEQFDAAGLSLGFTESSSLGAVFSEWSVTRRNLIEHPTPVDVSEWTTSPATGTFSVNTDVVRRAGVGTYSRTLSGASTLILQAYLTPTTSPSGAYPVSGGQYVVSGFVRSTALADRAQISFTCYDADGALAGSINVVAPVGGVADTWVRVSALVSAPAGSVTAMPGIAVFAAASAPIGTRTWLTDVMLERGGDLLPFMYDGMPGTASTRFRWEGTPNDSPTIEETRGVLSAGMAVTGAWMHNPLNPAGAVKVTLLDTAVRSLSRPVPGEVSYPSGRRVGVVLSEPRRGLAGAVFDVFCETHEDADKVQALIGTYSRSTVPVVCIRTGSDNPMRVAMPLFLGVFDIPEEDIDVRWGKEHTVQRIAGDEVDPPIPGLYVPTLTRDDINISFDSRAAVNAAALTRSDINRLYALSGAAG